MKSLLKNKIAKLASKDWSRPHWRILYYHGVEANEVISFRAQLERMQQYFTWCSVSDGVRAMNEGKIDRPLMSITFDDADLSVYDNALSILVDLGVPACIYTVPGYVLHGHSFRDPIPRATMSWEQLRDCLAAGIEIGSHTLTHVESARCPDDRLEQEFRVSKDIIEQSLGTKATHFAYPWGQHDERTQRVIAGLGIYDSVALIKRGSMENGGAAMALRRDRMDVRSSPARVEETMRLADRFYRLTSLRRQHFVSYTDRHPEERWEPFTQSELTAWSGR